VGSELFIVDNSGTDWKVACFRSGELRGAQKKRTSQFLKQLIHLAHPWESDYSLVSGQE
jgi:hypothetical protein